MKARNYFTSKKLQQDLLEMADTMASISNHLAADNIPEASSLCTRLQNEMNLFSMRLRIERGFRMGLREKGGEA